MTWIVRTTAMAQDDFDKIVVQSAEHFGAPQALRYAHLIRRAIQEVEAITLPGGATVFGGPEQGIFLRRIARRGRRSSHVLVLYVVPGEGQPTIDVARILHERMDIASHLPARDDPA